MKITKPQLKQIIKEELSKVMKEQLPPGEEEIEGAFTTAATGGIPEKVRAFYATLPGNAKAQAYLAQSVENAHSVYTPDELLDTWWDELGKEAQEQVVLLVTQLLHTRGAARAAAAWEPPSFDALHRSIASRFRDLPEWLQLNISESANYLLKNVIGAEYRADTGHDPWGKHTAAVSSGAGI